MSPRPAAEHDARGDAESSQKKNDGEDAAWFDHHITPTRNGVEIVSATGRAPARERISWALYDFANTVFSMNMATLFFSAWIVADFHRSNTLYATVNGITS